MEEQLVQKNFLFIREGNRFKEMRPMLHSAVEILYRRPFRTTPLKLQKPEPLVGSAGMIGRIGLATRIAVKFPDGMWRYSREIMVDATGKVSTSFSRRDALGEIKDEAEDNFDEDTWFSVDEKMNKMTKDSIVELLEGIPLPPPFSARVPALQEPANYGTDLETSIYEGQISSGYRVPMHPFDVTFFNHYKMVPGQLVPNGWRKLVGLIYLVQSSGYLVTVDDFMRLYLELPSYKWEFPRKWNGFCKYYEKKGSLAPNATTKKLIDHIKRRGVLSIDEPFFRSRDAACGAHSSCPLCAGSSHSGLRASTCFGA
ncbi:hypothetical protein RJ639_009538 [Escallonia herrerae]|uniref:Transposase (putative) gypsy type domain-containing protein n=1 Tax=Escallonia herrerae TaxID=1293975 RepID=A0AA88VSN5_9ASTE|nr:hypothetical protein RJ639_009538 [Escallonia herrerae]